MEIEIAVGLGCMPSKVKSCLGVTSLVWPTKLFNKCIPNYTYSANAQGMRIITLDLSIRKEIYKVVNYEESSS